MTSWDETGLRESILCFGTTSRSLLDQ